MQLAVRRRHGGQESQGAGVDLRENSKATSALLFSRVMLNSVQQPGIEMQVCSASRNARMTAIMRVAAPLVSIVPDQYDATALPLIPLPSRRPNSPCACIHNIQQSEHLQLECNQHIILSDAQHVLLILAHIQPSSPEGTTATCRGIHANPCVHALVWRDIPAEQQSSRGGQHAASCANAPG